LQQIKQKITTQTITTQAPQAVGRIANSVGSILASQGGYFADKLYRFTIAANQQVNIEQVQNKNTAKPRWLVVGREHYFETSKEYPIANKRDLKQALKFEDNVAPFQGITLQAIERIDEQNHRVTFWVLKPHVLDFLPATPWLILPETYLLAKALNKNDKYDKGDKNDKNDTSNKEINFATIECINKSLFLSKTGQGITSGIQSPQAPTAESFALLSGSPLNNENGQVVLFPFSSFTQLLYNGIKSLDFIALHGFFIKRKSIDWQNYPWKQASVICTITFALHLALSSGWLVYKQHALDQKLSGQITKVNQALNLQKQYKKQSQWQQTLITPLKKQVPYWNVWPIILESISVGTVIKSIHYKNDKIMMSGVANKSIKATDVLAKLAKNPYVESPTFSKPVRKYKNKEEFTISFNFAQTEWLQGSSKSIAQRGVNAN